MCEWSAALEGFEFPARRSWDDLAGLSGPDDYGLQCGRRNGCRRRSSRRVDDRGAGWSGLARLKLDVLDRGLDGGHRAGPARDRLLAV